MIFHSERHDYKAGDMPEQYKLYLVWVDKSIGGNDRFYLATYHKNQYADEFVPRDLYLGNLFDEAVVYWWNIPTVE